MTGYVYEHIRDGVVWHVAGDIQLWLGIPNFKILDLPLAADGSNQRE